MQRPTLARRAGRALAVNVVNTVVSRLGTLAIGIALARILGPEEFGTFAFALVALLAVLSFNELGVSLAIVRWPDPPDKIAPTVATLSTGASVVLATVAVALAPVFCDLMGAPAATDIVRVLAASIVISGLVATSAALMQREFRAGRRMLIDQVVNWVGAFVSIGAALGGMGAMSLAAGRVVSTLIGAAMFLHAAPVRFGFDREIARRLLHFGIPLAGSSIVVFAVKFADQLIVGAVLGPVALGFYVLAFNLSNWPVSVLSQPVRDVSPAAFARLQRDPPALRSAFVSSVGLLAAVTLPVCLVLSGAAEPLISVVYGAEWAPAAAVLGWLGLLAGLRILFELFYDYFVVIGITRVIFRIQLLWFAALLPAVYAGAEMGGIAGAAAAQVLVAGLVVLPYYLLALARAGIPWLSVARGLAVPVGCGAAVAAVSFAAQRFISLDLLALVVAGLAVLAALGVEARKMRATAHTLRTAVSSAPG
jgi:O-antigen/teichoic acid export membrane protein